jgi:hypothetical protein
MFRFCGRIIAGVVVSIACLPVAGSLAQDAILADLYGNGVHAYFSNNVQQALDDLTAAVDSGSKDPRVFYFRGLVERRMGMEANADEDFARGAELEANAADGFYPVSRSLERVQGTERLAIERHRAKARAIAYKLNQNREEQRYQRIQRAEADVLREVEGPPAAINPPVQAPAPAPEAPAAVAPAEADLFSEPAAEAAPAAKPEPAAEPENADPFADEAPAEKAPAKEAPAEEDPFAAGADKAEAAAEAPAPKAEAEADDPFAAPAEEKPADDKPAPKAEAEDDDPFAAGEDKAAAEEKPAEEKDAEEDPFN